MHNVVECTIIVVDFVCYFQACLQILWAEAFACYFQDHLQILWAEAFVVLDSILITNRSRHIHSCVFQFMCIWNFWSRFVIQAWVNFCCSLIIILRVFNDLRQMKIWKVFMCNQNLRSRLGYFRFFCAYLLLHVNWNIWSCWRCFRNMILRCNIISGMNRSKRYCHTCYFMCSWNI